MYTYEYNDISMEQLFNKHLCILFDLNIYIPINNILTFDLRAFFLENKLRYKRFYKQHKHLIFYLCIFYVKN